MNKTMNKNSSHDPNFGPGAKLMENVAAFAGLFAAAGIAAGWELAYFWRAGKFFPAQDLLWIFSHGGFTQPPTIAGAIVGALAGAVIGYKLGWRPSERFIRGSQLARVQDLQQPRADGLHIHPQVKLTQSQETGHLMLLGGSGSGKTTILWPLLHQIAERGDRAIVFSFKGDFQERWPTNKFVLLAPWDKRSAHWKTGRDIRTRMEAESLAETLVPTPTKGETIWANGAQALLVAVISDLQSRHGENWSMRDLAEATAFYLSDYDALVEVVTRESPVARSFLMGKDSKTTASFLAQMAAGLGGVAHMGVAEYAARQAGGKLKAWSVQRWLAGKTAPVAIIGYRPGSETLSKAWAASIIEAAVQGVLQLEDCAPAHRKVWLIIDEAPQAGRIPSITQALEAARSKGVRVVLGLQSTSQVEREYDAETRKAWAGLTANKIFARLQEPEDQRWASSLVGDVELERFHNSTTTAAGAGSSVGSQYQRVREPLILPAQFGTDLRAEYPRRVRAVLMTAGGTAIADWKFPKIDPRRKAFVPASWTLPGFKRPTWGNVPPRVGTPTEGEEKATEAQRQHRTITQPITQAAAPTQQQQAEAEAETGDADPAAEVAAKLVLDHLTGGLSSAVELAAEVVEAGKENGAAPAAAAPPAPQAEAETETEDEWEP